MRKRILSAYPEWTDWSKEQKSILIMRATHGKIHWKEDHIYEDTMVVDSFHPTLDSYKKTLGMRYSSNIERLIEDGLKEALEDFDKTGAFRHGKTKKGGLMKRPCTPEELFTVMMYDLTPTSMISIMTGARRSLTNPEVESLAGWLATPEQTEKVRYIDSSRKQEKHYFDKLMKSQDRVRELELQLNPVEKEEELDDEDDFEDYPYVDDEDED